MKKFISALLALSMAFTLASCGNSQKETPSSPSHKEDMSEKNDSEKTSLVYGSHDYTRINPALDEHGEINVLIFDGLTAHGKGNKLEPRLAKSWEYDEDSFTYTFHLNEGVKWHDGKPFTADDVKFTFEAIMDPENDSENASNYEDVEEINVIDENTVSFKLSSPNYAFLDYMTMAILPKHLLEGEDMQTSDFFRAPVGTGPYKMASWDMGQAIILEKNEEYFNKKANIDTIIFKIVPDDITKALQLKSGELDLAQVTPKDAATFNGLDGFTIYDMTTSDYRGILYNFGNEYWQKNADLIPAISFAIDRKAIIDSVLLGQGEIAYGPIQRNEYNFEDVEHYDYDPQKAAELLEEAGCKKGDDGFYYRDGEKIGFTINASSDDQVRVDMATIVAQQLQEIGLDVKANIPEAIDWGNQEACIIGWGSPFDADDHTYKVFGTDKGANYSGYSNKDVDKFLTEARQTNDPEKRKEAYAKFQTALAEKPAYTFFCYIDAMYVGKNNIKGIDKENVLGHHGVGIFQNITEWTIE